MILEGWDAEGIRVRAAGGRTVRLTVADLTEGTAAAFDPESGQRLGSMVVAERAIRLTGFAEQPEGWSFETNTGDPLFVSPRDVQAYVDPTPARPAPKLWQTMVPRPFDYPSYRTEDAVRRDCLLEVARHGWALLADVPVREGEVEAVVGSFGFVRETNYGRVFDVRSKPAVANLADTTRALEPHTDNPYRDPVPGLQLLHCLADSAVGGETRLVDGFAIAELLRQHHAEDFAVLARTPVRFAWSDGAHILEATKPVITLAPDGTLVAVRYNSRAFRRVEGDAEARAAWRRAIAHFAELVGAPEQGVTFKLRPGDCVIMDNTRILHGRTAFADGRTGARHLQGAYADRDGLLSTLAVLTAREVAARMERLCALFASEAMGLSYGEDLSIRDHQLQAAALAAGAGHPASLIAAALLHDIGWALPRGAQNHDRSGAEILAALFPPAVVDPVRRHVAAKRYLVTADPDYLACLSQASIDTLALQGGPMTSEEALQFAAMPGFEAAVILRRIDDAAKIPGKRVPAFAAYAAVLEQLIAEQLGA